MTGGPVGLAISRYVGAQFLDSAEANGNKNGQAHGADRRIGVCARCCNAQRGIWFLQRPRYDCDIAKFMEAPLKGEVLIAPGALEDLEHLGEALAALPVGYPIGLVCAWKAAAAYTEDKASVADVIKGCDLLGQSQWMTQRQHLDSNADFHATSSRRDGAGDQERSRGDRPLWREVQFRKPDRVEAPALGRVDLSKGLSKCLCICLSCAALKLVKDTELE